MCRHDDDPEIISRTSGRAIPDVEVRIVDDEGNALPAGTPGDDHTCSWGIRAITD